MESAPKHVDVDQLASDLVEVHDLHVWTLTTRMDAGECSSPSPPGTDTYGVLDQARQLLREEHGVSHATVQVEPTDHEGQGVLW